MEMKAIQRIEKRWTRQGLLLSLFGYLPLQICMSFLRCPEKRRRGTEGWGKGQESEQRKDGQGGDVRYSFCLTLVSCFLFDARTVIREREKEKERKRWVSNSSDQGTPHRKRNCRLHCQPMAIPASSPLNIKQKHNVHIQYVTFL